MKVVRTFSSDYSTIKPDGSRNKKNATLGTYGFPFNQLRDQTTRTPTLQHMEKIRVQTRNTACAAHETVLRLLRMKNNKLTVYSVKREKE